MPSAQISWERVLEVDPEMIVLALCGYGVKRALRDAELFRQFPHFDSLTASRNDDVYVVDGSSYFARPGARIADSLEILAGILHPSEFPESIFEGRDPAGIMRIVGDESRAAEGHRVNFSAAPLRLRSR